MIDVSKHQGFNRVQRPREVQRSRRMTAVPGKNFSPVSVILFALYIISSRKKKEDSGQHSWHIIPLHPTKVFFSLISLPVWRVSSFPLSTALSSSLSLSPSFLSSSLVPLSLPFRVVLSFSHHSSPSLPPSLSIWKLPEQQAVNRVTAEFIHITSFGIHTHAHTRRDRHSAWPQIMK